MSAILGRRALEDAFRELVTFVDHLMTAGVDLSTVQAAPTFSYILTRKQLARVKEICRQENWSMPQCPGIEIHVGTVAHILESRLQDRGVTPSFVADVLICAYCENAEVHINKRHGMNHNKGHNHQAVFLNAVVKLPLNGAKWNAVAIVAVNDGPQKKMASVTAYHADEAKIRSIKKR